MDGGDAAADGARVTALRAAFARALEKTERACRCACGGSGAATGPAKRGSRGTERAETASDSDRKGDCEAPAERIEATT
jgi:hypothetical protein